MTYMKHLYLRDFYTISFLAFHYRTEHKKRKYSDIPVHYNVLICQDI